MKPASMKGIAYWVITMHKMGTPTEDIQALLDNADFRESKLVVLNMVSTYINSITQQQVAQTSLQGEKQ